MLLHLPAYRPRGDTAQLLAMVSGEVHPAVLQVCSVLIAGRDSGVKWFADGVVTVLSQLGVMMANGRLQGSNARAIGLLTAFAKVCLGMQQQQW